MAATFVDATALPKKLLSRPQVTLRAKPSSTCSTDNTGNPGTSASARSESIISRKANNDSSRKGKDMVDMDGETFNFDHVKWADASQEQVYKAAAYPFVEKSLQGYDATVLAYGAARTGKSYTMGTLVPKMKNHLSDGLIQRSLRHIFEQPEIQVSASIVEVFNEKVHDLLNHGVELTVHEGTECCARIKRIKLLEDGFHLVRRAFRLRQEHLTSGSQSHAVLTFHLKVKDGENCFESKLNLIDMAGSKVEQPKEAGSKDLGERCCFEESLAALARVMVKESNSLKDLFKSNSILTSILKDSLDANCLVSLIACVNLEANDQKVNLRTLLFADVARTMKIEPKLGAPSGGPLSKKLVTDSAAGSMQTEAIALNQDKNTTCKVSTQPNVKNCVVVLKPCGVDSYISNRDKKTQKCDKSTEQQNPTVSSPDNGATRSPLGTPSTVSISGLETPNAKENNYQRNTTDEKTWTCFDDSFSISPLGDNSSENLRNLGDEEPPGSPEYYLTCECACRCSLGVTPEPAEESVTVIEPTRDEFGGKLNLSLADNVSQLSICSEEQTKIPVPCCAKARESSRSDNTTSDYVHELERLEMMRRLEVSNRMKRRGATLTVDISEPGPSRLAAGPTPRKVQKFEDDEPSSNVHSDEGSPKADDSDSEDVKDFVDTKNVGNDFNEKQKAQNEYILGVLNSCSVKHLQMLPRIGSKTAISIYQYRLIHGEFKSLNDLRNLPMWTPHFFNKFLMANNVTLE